MHHTRFLQHGITFYNQTHQGPNTLVQRGCDLSPILQAATRGHSGSFAIPLYELISCPVFIYSLQDKLIFIYHLICRACLAHRYRNLKLKSQSGLLLPWGLHELSFGIHANATRGVLPTRLADAADSHGCIGLDIRTSVVVRRYKLLHALVWGKSSE